MALQVFPEAFSQIALKDYRGLPFNGLATDPTMCAAVLTLRNFSVAPVFPTPEECRTVEEF
jgi:hypothetical protein